MALSCALFVVNKKWRIFLCCFNQLIERKQFKYDSRKRKVNRYSMYIFGRNHNPNKTVSFSFRLSVGKELLNFNTDGGK